jgi:hypothetical protein
MLTGKAESIKAETIDTSEVKVGINATYFLIETQQAVNFNGNRDGLLVCLELRHPRLLSTPSVPPSSV